MRHPWKQASLSWVKLRQDPVAKFSKDLSTMPGWEGQAKDLVCPSSKQAGGARANDYDYQSPHFPHSALSEPWLPTTHISRPSKWGCWFTRVSVPTLALQLCLTKEKNSGQRLPKGAYSGSKESLGSLPGSSGLGLLWWTHSPQSVDETEPLPPPQTLAWRIVDMQHGGTLDTSLSQWETSEALTLYGAERRRYLIMTSWRWTPSWNNKVVFLSSQHTWGWEGNLHIRQLKRPTNINNCGETNDAQSITDAGLQTGWRHNHEAAC